MESKSRGGQGRGGEASSVLLIMGDWDRTITGAPARECHPQCISFLFEIIIKVVNAL